MDGLDILALISETLPAIQEEGDGTPLANGMESIDPSGGTSLPYYPGLGSSYIMRNLPGSPTPSANPTAAVTPLTNLMPGESAGIPNGQYGGGISSRGSRGIQRRMPTVRTPAPPRPRNIPPVRGNAGIDISNLDLGQLLFLVLHPQGPQIISLMSQGQQQKRQEELQRQQMVLQQAQIERQNQLADLNARLLLQQQGAMPVPPIQPGFGSDILRQGTAGRRVAGPGGDYLLPTPEQQQQRARDAYRSDEEYKAKTKAEIDEKYDSVPVSPELVRFFGLGFTRQMSRAKVQSMVSQYNASKPENERVQVVSNSDGTLTIVRINGQKVTTETMPGGPNRPAAGGQSGDYTPYQRYQIDQNEYKDQLKEYEDADKATQSAQALINKARSIDAIPGQNPGDPNTSPEWKAARIAAEDAARKYPNHVQAGVDANGYPYVKLVGQRPRAPKVVSAPTGKAGGPGVNQALQERDYALQRYNEMRTAGKHEQRDPQSGLTPREWFRKRYGLDPEQLLLAPQ